MQNKCSSCFVCKLVCLLVLIGALNWGLVGFFQFNLVTAIFGDMTMGARIVYGLVGVAGLLKIVSCFKPCSCCNKEESSGSSCCSH